MEQVGGQKTILVVDDEDDVRDSVREVLSDEGYRVLDTADGTRVLEMIREERPELVLLDIWMPQVDGIGLLKQIKSHEPEINVVMVSGHGNIHTAVTATKYGAFDFIETTREHRCHTVGMPTRRRNLRPRPAYSLADVSPIFFDSFDAPGSSTTRRARPTQSRDDTLSRPRLCCLRLVCTTEKSIQVSTSEAPFWQHLGADHERELRRTEKLGPARIARRLGMKGSTVYRVLRRAGRVKKKSRPPN